MDYTEYRCEGSLALVPSDANDGGCKSLSQTECHAAWYEAPGSTHLGILERSHDQPPHIRYDEAKTAPYHDQPLSVRTSSINYLLGT